MARGAAAAVVIFLVGVLGLWAAFSDLSPNETLLQRVVVVALVYLLGGSFVGILLPRRWYLAALTAWGPVAIGALSLAVRLSGPGRLPSPRVSFLLVLLVGIPLWGLATGLLGRWFILRRGGFDAAGS